MNAGDAFLCPAKDEHLWMVISDPAADADHVVIVNLTSWKQGGNDSSGIVNTGEHPFVRHRSFVYYGGAKVDPLSHLKRLRTSGGLVLEDPLSEELLARIRLGAESSRWIPSFARQVLVDQGLIDVDP